MNKAIFKKVGAFFDGMKITISGTPGSGKTTVGKLLAKKRNYSYYDAGSVRREIAKREGMTLEQLNKVGEKEDWTDKKTDNLTKEIGKKHDNFVFVGRLAFHFIPDSTKIFLECDLKEGAKRIFKDKRAEEKSFDVKEMVKKLEERNKSDELRYEKYYGLNPFDKSQYDIVIDTTFLSIEQVLEKIIDVIE